MANGIVDTLSWWPFSDLFEEDGLYSFRLTFYSESTDLLENHKMTNINTTGLHPAPFSNQSLPVDGLMNVYGWISSSQQGIFADLMFYTSGIPKPKL